MQEVNLATNDEGRKVLDMDAIHSLASHLKGDIIVYTRKQKGPARGDRIQTDVLTAHRP